MGIFDCCFEKYFVETVDLVFGLRLALIYVGIWGLCILVRCDYKHTSW